MIKRRMHQRPSLNHPPEAERPDRKQIAFVTLALTHQLEAREAFSRDESLDYMFVGSLESFKCVAVV